MKMECYSKTHRCLHEICEEVEDIIKGLKCADVDPMIKLNAYQMAAETIGECLDGHETIHDIYQMHHDHRKDNPGHSVGMSKVI